VISHILLWRYICSHGYDNTHLPEETKTVEPISPSYVRFKDKVLQSQRKSRHLHNFTVIWYDSSCSKTRTWWWILTKVVALDGSLLMYTSFHFVFIWWAKRWRDHCIVCSRTVCFLQCCYNTIVYL